MIAAVKGTLIAREASLLVVDVNGIGYAVNVPSQVSAGLAVGDEVNLHTAFIIRDDAFLLYGFSSAAQRTLFDLLRSVTGVGPKSALAVLSQLNADAISNAVANEDPKPFESVTGIGSKTAKLITVTLAGKLVAAHSRSDNPQASVLSALIGLGWTEKLASQAIAEAIKSGTDSSQSDQMLRAALLNLGKR